MNHPIEPSPTIENEQAHNEPEERLASELSTQQVVFIHGIMPRSGTNYVAKLLACHKDIAEPTILWEDFLLANTKHLNRYFKACQRKWNPKWDKEQLYLNRTRFLSHLGQGLLSYILAEENSPESSKVLLTKTPSVNKIDQFYDLFPNNKLIIIVRDGRSLVESGIKSFGWDFEKAAKDWSKQAEAIKSLQDKQLNETNQPLIIKYEDLYQHPKQTAESICNYLGLELDRMDMEALANLKVIGSSDLAQTQGEISWDALLPSDQSFAPLSRHKNWSKNKQKRFDWLAQPGMEKLNYKDLDYSPTSMSTAARMKQRLLDWSWAPRVLPKLLIDVFYHRRNTISTK
jgi:protein-tyrosine sulfotransferase